MTQQITISFITDDEQLARVDALAQEMGRASRSAMLRQLIDAGMPVLKAARKISESFKLEPLPIGAFPNADADLVVA
jgi:metal-responsive CopG/Arc/MetJ family transcriptional regulator